ncbi:MAG: ABC transporter permease [Halobacteriota archaeon]
MDFTTTLLAVIVGVILLFIAVLAVRHRILFTMGVRNFARRPKNTVVVIAGLLISTAVISGSLVAGDSFNYTIQKITYDTLGPVDEVVTVGSQYGTYQFFNASAYDKLAGDPSVTGLVAGIAPEVSINVPLVRDASSGVTATGARVFGTNLTVDKSFGSFTLLDGTRTDATDLGANEVLIQNKLARELDAHVGDTLTVYGGSTGSALSARNFTIKYIAQDEGKAQYGLGLNVYTTLEAAQAFAQKPGQITGIRITNMGSAENGAAGSTAVVDTVTRALAGLPLTFTVSPIKQNLLTQAQNTGAQISSLFVLLSAFSVAAGVALIINILVMLAEERKSELGIVRAIGLPRGNLIELILFEGVIYAVIAAALGSVIGIGVGAALTYGFNSLFTNLSSPLSVHFTASMVFEAFLIGMLVTLATVGLTSFRISRINIIQAIRDTEEEVDTGRSTRIVAASALLVVIGMALYAVAGSNILIKVLAPTLAVLGAGLLGSRFTSSRWTFSMAGVVLVAYILYLSIYTLAGLTSSDANTLLVAGGIVLVIGVVLVVVMNVTILVRALNGVFGRTRALGAIIKPSLAYPFNKMFRTGLTVTMFSLVTFIIVFFAVSGATYQVNVAQQAGGYDVRATSAVALSNLTNAQAAEGTLTAQTPGVVSPSVTPFNTSEVVYSDGLFAARVYGLTVNNQTVQYQGPPFDTVYGIDAPFINHTTYTFSNSLENATSTQSAWQSLDNPRNVILDSGYRYGSSNTPVKAGDTVRFVTANGTATFTVSGVLDESYLHGVFMGKPAMQQVFPTITGNSLFLIKTAPGVDPLNVTYDLKRDFQQYGVDAGVIRDEVLQLNQQNNVVYGVIQVFLGLGLIIGVASLGIIAVRSVHERRRDIGIMLAMGLEKRKVFLSILIEVLFITILGSLIGLFAGVASSYAAYLSISQPMNPFTIPVTLLVAIYAIIFAAAIICTIGPARAAATLPPAEAVRYSE